MTVSTKIIKNLLGEFVSPEVVKLAQQKDYNMSVWNRNVDAYNKYSEVKFFKTEGTIYAFDYYVIYIVDGIRFLGKVEYSSSLSSGGFCFGFFNEGIKDIKILEALQVLPEYKDIHLDSLTILGYENNFRISTCNKARQEMREETIKNKSRFFTKEF